MTFSLVARDPRTGQLGVGAVTAMVGVGKLVPYVRAGVGAIASQAMINPYLGLDGLDHLADGLSAPEALDAVLAADPGREFRQCGIIDARGVVAAWTGEETPGWSGHILDDNVSAQGNRLVHRGTIEAVVETFHDHSDLELAWRMYKALLRGEHTGADKQGAMSATIRVMDREAYPLWDVRVDHADDPVAALGEVMEQFAEQLLPLVRKLSTRDDQTGRLVRERRDSIG